ncbi:hypothetical protein MUK42_33036 [Musa troglodytarum]|uniref:Uncharacterized protein n=1 Tax=Musa troglodytarum TaxID=320322 RepID=A0A9E7F7Y3_9LILI|nr:hypothetical protein MUK42_33036 [Musa troglodytarum]
MLQQDFVDGSGHALTKNNVLSGLRLLVQADKQRRHIRTGPVCGCMQSDTSRATVSCIDAEDYSFWVRGPPANHRVDRNKCFEARISHQTTSCVFSTNSIWNVTVPRTWIRVILTG